MGGEDFRESQFNNYTWVLVVEREKVVFSNNNYCVQNSSLAYGGISHGFMVNYSKIMPVR